MPITLTRVAGRAVRMDGTLTVAEVPKILDMLAKDPERSIDLSEMFRLGPDGKTAFEQVGQWAIENEGIQSVRVFVPKTMASVLFAIANIPGLIVDRMG